MPEAHKRPGVISDFILGSQDGIVNVLGVILGIGIASNNFKILLVGGLAATFAESISMGAVAYTSTLARRDHYLAELARERNEMLTMPAMETEEVREILRHWGLEDEAVEAVTKHIVANPKAWLEIMMSEELGLSPVSESQARRSGALVLSSALVGSLIPLVPVLFLQNDVHTGILVSLVLSAVTLFFIGWYKSKVTIGKPYRSGLQMAIIGTVSALAGFLVGLLLSGGKPV